MELFILLCIKYGVSVCKCGCSRRPGDDAGFPRLTDSCELPDVRGEARLWSPNQAVGPLKHWAIPLAPSSLDARVAHSYRL